MSARLTYRISRGVDWFVQRCAGYVIEMVEQLLLGLIAGFRAYWRPFLLPRVGGFLKGARSDADRLCKGNGYLWLERINEC
jgi:hypothetical protein